MTYVAWIVCKIKKHVFIGILKRTYVYIICSLFITSYLNIIKLLLIINNLKISAFTNTLLLDSG